MHAHQLRCQRAAGDFDDEVLAPNYPDVCQVDAQQSTCLRTWYRRDTGWFGLAVNTTRARVRVPGVEVDVRIEDVGVGPSGLRANVDAAYRDKYGGGSTGNMVGDGAAATTLRLDTE